MRKNTSGGFGDFFGFCTLSKKKCLNRQDLLSVNGATASSQANRDKSSNCDLYVTSVDVCCSLKNVLVLNLCCAICISQGLI